MKKLGAMVLVAVVAILTMQVSVNATPSIGITQEWGTLGTTDGWTADPLSSNVIAVTHNDAGGYLQISVTGGAMPGYGRAITTGGPGTNYFKGDYAAIGAGNGQYVLDINFRFYAETTTPGELWLYFQSGGPSGHIWAYDVAGLNGSPVANDWTTYSVAAGTNGWIAQNGAWTVGQLLSDWANVSWLGVYIQGSSGGTENYGLDDMYLSYSVPEPETVWMILVVVLSLGITFRSRLVDTMSQMKTRFTKI